MNTSIRKTGIVMIAAAVCLMLNGCGSAKTEYISAGMQYIEAMDYASALESFEQAAANGEQERLVARGMGIAYIGLTEYESAIDSFLLCLSESDGMVQEMDYDVNYYLAAAYQRTEQYSEAVAVYDAILAMRPDETDALYLRGNAFLSLGQYEQAKADFDRTVELEPNDFDRLIQIYEVLAADGYREVGEEYLQTALDARSNRMTDFDKGRVYYYLGQYEQAQVCLEAAKENGGADAFLYLGMAYEATGDYNYAITSVYTNFLNRGEGNAEIYNQMGLCFLKQENYEAALDAFQNALKLSDTDLLQTLRFNEIVAYEYLGEYTQAEVLLSDYLKTYPDDVTAQREHDFLSTR